MLQGKGYTKAVDWWSFGSLVYEMLSGLVCYFSPTTIFFKNKFLSFYYSASILLARCARDVSPHHQGEVVILQCFLPRLAGAARNAPREGPRKATHWHRSNEVTSFLQGNWLDSSVPKEDHPIIRPSSGRLFIFVSYYFPYFHFPFSFRKEPMMWAR